MRRLIGILTAVVIASFALAGAGCAQETTSEFDGLDEAQIAEAWDFAIGNSLFVLMHEAGHMLISEFELPVLGREEDAVDALSTLIMLESDDYDFDNALIDAADGWFMLGAASKAAGEDFTFWDEHSVEEQRAYAIICMMIGQDAEQFTRMSAADEIPEERRESCGYEYHQTAVSWYKVLQPHIRDDEQRETPVTIVYDDAPDGGLAPYAEKFRESDLLGIAKSLLADDFALDEGITFHMTSCGEPNAFWDPEDRTLTYCYELAQLHAGLIADYLRDEQQ